MPSSWTPTAHSSRLFKAAESCGERYGDTAPVLLLWLDTVDVSSPIASTAWAMVVGPTTPSSAAESQPVGGRHEVQGSRRRAASVRPRPVQRHLVEPALGQP